MSRLAQKNISKSIDPLPTKSQAAELSTHLIIKPVLIFLVIKLIYFSWRQVQVTTCTRIMILTTTKTTTTSKSLSTNLSIARTPLSPNQRSPTKARMLLITVQNSAEIRIKDWRVKNLKGYFLTLIKIILWIMQTRMVIFF